MRLLRNHPWLNAAGIPLGYVLVSAIACGVDFALTVALAAMAAHPVLAAVTGYSVGAAVHWALSSRMLFVGAMASSSAMRDRQLALFLLSGLAGLAATVLIFANGCALGLPAAAAKLLAIGGSFAATYMWRRYLIFGVQRAA